VGCPNFTTPSLRGVELGERGPAAKRGNAYLPRLARLLMQLHGSSQVSPQSALGNESVRARAHLSGVQAAVCFAGVAQLVEHLFCKQVVRGSSPRASSVQSPVGASGEGACGFRVLASFGLRSGAHVLKYAPLRCSPKPRQNAELRRRVSAGLGAVQCTALSPKRSASSLLTDRETSESCPSGQREQAVNLPDLSYAGSNPALSTSAPRLPAGTNRRGFCFTDLGRGRSRAMTSFAGVAQLVERQPSKLNVEGSSPFSRSTSFGSSLGSRPSRSRVSSDLHPLATRWTLGSTRVGSLVAGEAEPRTGAERTPVREHRTAGEVKPAGKIPTRRHWSLKRHYKAHLAQMVEHVLGKDEVTSSILVVGSKQ
jgi:hypothetical protein